MIFQGTWDLNATVMQSFNQRKIWAFYSFMVDCFVVVFGQTVGWRSELIPYWKLPYATMKYHTSFFFIHFGFGSHIGNKNHSFRPKLEGTWTPQPTDGYGSIPINTKLLIPFLVGYSHP